ncbi:fused nickel transport protein NikMN [bacterium BMS3Abin05]|nr:fused nickel transport protein NikMN [bacterium BMS3Abin05]
MHIPDGYLSPQTYIPMYGIVIPLSIYAFKKAKKVLDEETLPLITSLTALSFIIMMFNIPVPGGTSGHAIGVAVIAILFGPWMAFLSTSLVLFIQAILFGDGGITSFPINTFSMGFLASFTAYYTFRILKGTLKDSLNAFISGWLSIVAASLAVSIFLGIQPLIASGPGGQPLFFPFGLKITIPAMVGSHILFFGIAEGIFTTVTLNFVRKIDPRFFSTVQIKAVKKRTLYIGLFTLFFIVLVPLGLLTENPAWGEWTSAHYQKILGFVPEGMQKFGGLYTAPAQDYGFKYLNSIASYYLSAVMGALLILLFFYVLYQLLYKKKNQFDRTFFLGYILVILLLTLSGNLYLLSFSLFTLFLLSGKTFFKLFKRAGAAILFFNSIVTVSYILLTYRTHTFSPHYVLLINLRTFTLTFATFLLIDKVNLFSVFSFSKTLTYAVTLSYSQILTFKRILGELRFALRSRIIRKPGKKEAYNFVSSSVYYFLNKSLSNSKEILQAMKSRGFNND